MTSFTLAYNEQFDAQKCGCGSRFVVTELINITYYLLTL